MAESSLAVLLLAQIADTFSPGFWTGLLVVGLALPAAAALVSLFRRALYGWKVLSVIVFYALAIPLGTATFGARTEKPELVIPFLLLLPAGVLLGLVVLFSSRRRAPLK